MTCTANVIAELNLLQLFDLNNSTQGLKVHSQDASAETIAAAARLFDKGLIDKPDGGYLTAIGREAAEHFQKTLTLMQVESE